MNLPDPAALARAVAAHLRAHPETHRQDEWYVTASGERPTVKEALSIPVECGTAACVAGWAVLLSTVTPSKIPSAWDVPSDLPSDHVGVAWERLGRDLLNLTPAVGFRLSRASYGESEAANLDIDRTLWIAQVLDEMADLMSRSRLDLSDFCLAEQRAAKVFLGDDDEES